MTSQGETQNTKHKTQNTKHKIQNTKYRTASKNHNNLYSNQSLHIHRHISMTYFNRQEYVLAARLLYAAGLKNSDMYEKSLTNTLIGRLTENSEHHLAIYFSESARKVDVHSVEKPEVLQAVSDGELLTELDILNYAKSFYKNAYDLGNRNTYEILDQMTTRISKLESELGEEMNKSLQETILASNP